MKEGVFSLRYNEGGNEREVIISLYNHSILHFDLGNNQGWSAQGSDFILGYNHSHLYIGLGFNEGRSEGGVTVS